MRKYKPKKDQLTHRMTISVHPTAWAKFKYISYWQASTPSKMIRKYIGQLIEQDRKKKSKES